MKDNKKSAQGCLQSSPIVYVEGENCGGNPKVTLYSANEENHWCCRPLVEAYKKLESLLTSGQTLYFRESDKSRHHDLYDFIIKNTEDIQNAAMFDVPMHLHEFRSKVPVMYEAAVQLEIIKDKIIRPLSWQDDVVDYTLVMKDDAYWLMILEGSTSLGYVINVSFTVKGEKK
jgi:hypothetical protein